VHAQGRDDLISATDGAHADRGPNSGGPSDTHWNLRQARETLPRTQAARMTCESRRVRSVEKPLDGSESWHTVKLVGYKVAQIYDLPLEIKNRPDPRPRGGASQGW